MHRAQSYKLSVFVFILQSLFIVHIRRMSEPTTPRLPPLEEEDTTPRKEEPPTKDQGGEGNHLPAIVVSSSGSNRARQVGHVTMTESKAIIGSSDARVVGRLGATKQLPVEWTNQRVNQIETPSTGEHPRFDKQADKFAQQSKLGWDNQIAKHILSLFASKNAMERMDESKALLAYVHEPGNENKALDDNSKSKTIEGTKKKKKKKARKPTREVSTEHPFQIRGLKSFALNSEDNEEILRIKAERAWCFSIIDRIKNEIAVDAKDEFGEKYRKNNVIKTKEGEEIVVRGSARAFPIWFATTGDVYADWTALPGTTLYHAYTHVIPMHPLYTPSSPIPS